MSEDKMVIKVNAAGRKSIESLCDVALKVEGIRNLSGVVQILQAVKDIPVKSKKE